MEKSGAAAGTDVLVDPEKRMVEDVVKLPPDL